MTERTVNTRIPVIFQNIEEYKHEDSRFLKVKLWLMHTGINYNSSSFTKEVVESSLYSLANTPILSFIEENSEGEQDFSDHRIVLHRSEEGKHSLKYMGQAIGVIPSENNAHWEKRVADDGIEREYLVVDGLLWNKWDEPTDIMKRRKVTAQSMELDPSSYSGYFDDENIFHFESFKFFGACLLGIDTLPGMASSTAELQFSKNEDIQNTIEEKLQEFYALFSQDEPKGGNSMTEKVEKDYEKTEVEFEEVIETETTEETNTDSPSDNPEDSTDTTDTFEDESPTEETEAPESNESNSKTDVDEVAVETIEEIEEEKVDEPEVDYEAKFNEVNTELETLKSDYTSLQSQLAELQTYKRQREEADLKAKFEGKLSEEDFNQVFTDMKDSELDKVEEKLFALIGKKNFSIETSTKTNTSVNKINLNYQKDEQPKPYGGLIELYKNK